MAGDGGRCRGLHHIEPRAVDGPRRGRRFGLTVHRPGDDRLLLGQHRPGGEPGCGWFDPHRPSIRGTAGDVAWWVEVDEVLDDTVSGPLDGVEPAASRQLRHGLLPVADRLDHIGTAPRRPLRRDRLHDVGDRQPVNDPPIAGGLRDGLVELLDRRARPGGLGLPACRQIGDTVTGLAERVSADASRVNAARSHRDGSRPSR